MHSLKYRLGNATRFIKGILGLNDINSAFHINKIEEARTVIVLLSGDGGWRKFAKNITRKLNNSGYTTIGFDMLLYCWKFKSPEQIINDIVKQLEAIGPFERLVLVGYSYGANIIPFIANKIETVRKEKIQFILLAPSAKIDFEIKLSSVVFDKPGSLKVLPFLEKIPLNRTLIVTDDSSFSIHKELENRAILNTQIPGGHHFTGHVEKLYEHILRFLISPK